MFVPRTPGRRGAIYAMVAVALVAVVGTASLSVDIGRVVLAAQRAQNVADAAALAAVCAPLASDVTATEVRIGDTISGNNLEAGLPVEWDPTELVWYQGPATIPGYGNLQTGEEGLTVSVHCQVDYIFARIFGLTGTTVTRTATAARLGGDGLPIAPMWVGFGTPYSYGVSQDLHATDGPDAQGRVAGNFGWLVPPSGSGDFDVLLCGYQVPESLRQDNLVEGGDTLTGLPGQRGGHWLPDLGTSGNGRLARGTWQPWTSGTFLNHRNDDPRLLIVPICSYAGGTGGNAQWLIRDFGLWWLESATKKGNDKIVRGRFINYRGAGGSGTLDDYLGIGRTTKLVN